MTCEVVTLPGGFRAIVCGPKRRHRKCACGSGRPADLLCDWKVPGGTCDASLCSACTSKPARGKDLCGAHAAEWEQRKAER